MRGVLKNWNFKKHFVLIVSFYTLVLSITNSVMILCKYKKSEKEIRKINNWTKYISPEEKKRAVALSYLQEPSKPTKIVNGVLGVCFAVDMASYPLIKHLTKKL